MRGGEGVHSAHTFNLSWSQIANTLLTHSCLCNLVTLGRRYGLLILPLCSRGCGPMRACSGWFRPSHARPPGRRYRVHDEHEGEHDVVPAPCQAAWLDGAQHMLQCSEILMQARRGGTVLKQHGADRSELLEDLMATCRNRVRARMQSRHPSQVCFSCRCAANPTIPR